MAFFFFKRDWAGQLKADSRRSGKPSTLFFIQFSKSGKLRIYLGSEAARREGTSGGKRGQGSRDRAGEARGGQREDKSGQERAAGQGEGRVAAGECNSRGKGRVASGGG